MDDPHNLQRFVDAQAGVWEHAITELNNGLKLTHWMWFVFPQIAGLGSSVMARRYALAGLDEARDYLAHPVLGQRLREAVQAALDVPDRSAAVIFGAPDDLKFRSCLTLFRAAAPDDPLWQTALDHFFDGEPDAKTLAKVL